MVYLFLGQEHFLKKKTLDRLKARACAGANPELNYREFRAGEDDLKGFLDDAKHAPFLAKYRLFVITGAENLKKEDKGLIASFIENKPATSILAFTAGNLKQDDDIYRIASGRGRIMNFDCLKGPQLNKWIAGRFSQLGKKIGPAATAALTENTAGSLEQLDITAELLASFVGKRETVILGDVEKMVGKSLEATTYQLVDAIGSKNARLALQLMHGLEKDTRTVSQAIGLIGWHLRRIWRVKKGAATAGVPQYARQGFLKQAGNFSVKELERGFRGLLKLDTDIKSSPVHGYRALELLIIQLCGRHNT